MTMKWKLLLLSSIAKAPDGAVGGGSGGDGGSSGSATPAAAPGGGSSGGDTPASSSPSGADAAPATPSSDTPSPLDADTWMGFGEDEGDASISVEGTQAPPTTPKTPPAAATKPATTPPAKAPTSAAPAQPPAEAQPAVASVAEGQPQPGPQEAAPQGATPQLPSPAEPASMSQHLLQNIDTLADHLAGTPEFQLSEADVEALNTDFATALPKFGARMFVRAQASALAQMERVVPAMIQRYMKVSEARDKSQGVFYQRWPQIDKTKHGGVVDRLAQAYRRENPTATLEKMVEDLGPFVMMAAKIDPNVAAPVTQQQPGRAPAQSPMAAPQTRRPPASPFVPAVGGSSGQPQAPEENPWMGFGADGGDD